MTTQDLKDGVQQVRVKATGTEFNLSKVTLHGAIGLRMFPLDGKPPARGEHLMFSAACWEAWLDHLEPVGLGRKLYRVGKTINSGAGT